MIQAVLILSVVSAVGVYLGKIKFFGVSLGVTFVFFAGILAGHLGIEVNKDMLNFAQNFGLIIFVYTLGLQVGPGFFSSLKKGGVELNMMGLAVIVIGILCTLIFHWTSGISIPTMVGLLSGAVTNTPALGAAQQALIQMRPGETEAVTDMALACAVTYPLGVVGVILAIIVLRAMFAKKTENNHKEQDSTTFVAEFQVLNPSIYNKSIQEVMRLTEKHFVISRVWHEGKVCIPTSETEGSPAGHLHQVGCRIYQDPVRRTGEQGLEQGGYRLERDRQSIDIKTNRRHARPDQRCQAGLPSSPQSLRNQYNTGKPCGHRPAGLQKPSPADWRPVDDRRRGELGE